MVFLPALLFCLAAPSPRLQDPGGLITLESTFPFVPPTSAGAWANRRALVRRRVLVAAGLWPRMNPVQPHVEFRGTVERDGYRVECIRFESLPGFWVTGSLYRPTRGEGPFPGLLVPHGHWTGGRFSSLSDEEAIAAVERGEERYFANAKYHLQARCAQLARMGCIVLHYDMVGYADSKQLDHGSGLADAEAELWGLSLFGLQTRDSLQALEVLLSLDGVDSERIAVSGGSGGGTQTFILGAIDDRPAVLFPAVMVSTHMQGGCICENASHLRVGTGNVELAALAAPRPLGLTGANDWTVDILEHGFPELQALYRTLGAPDAVRAWCHPEFGHNFNAISRGHLYDFLDEHLALGLEHPIVEEPLLPIVPERLSFYGTGGERPSEGVEGVRAELLHLAQAEVAALHRLAGRDLGEYRRVVRGALAVLLAEETWDAPTGPGPLAGGGLILAGPGRSELGRTLAAEDGSYVATPPDLAPRWDPKRGEPLFTWCYNPTPLALRVASLARLSRVADGGARPALFGEGDQATAALLAAALQPERYTSVAIRMARPFRAADEATDPDFLPGLERYGGLAGMAALIAPTPLAVIGTGELPPVLRAAYLEAGAPQALVALPDPTAEELLEWFRR